jgi:DNA-binding CsgD family transcriptional regulator
MTPLTPREHEVLCHVVAGERSREIAAKLGISVRTVQNHRERTSRKLGARNVVEVVRIAIRGGLVDVAGATVRTAP